jgi:hypothetical protein
VACFPVQRCVIDKPSRFQGEKRMVVRHGALFRALIGAREAALRSALYRVLRVGWNAAVATVGAFTVLGMTSALVGGAPFDGVSRDAYRPGAFIGLQAQGNGETYLGAGWGAADESGRWMAGSASLLEIPSKGLPPRDVTLVVQAHGNPSLGKGDILVDVLANGAPAGRMRVSSTSGAQTFWLTIPGTAVARHAQSLILCLLASPDAPALGGAEEPLVKIDEIRLAAS